MSDITVYTARAIHTMNESLPIASAVACRDGMILEVGSLESLQPWLQAHPHRIDDQFADKVLMPGFIDPHLHPTMAAMILPCHFITAMDWKLPDRKAVAVKGHQAYVEQLKNVESELHDAEEPLVTWGYHRIWHGEMNVTLLDAISTSRPIIVWQRSFHEIIANSAAVDWLKLDRTQLASHPQVDLSRGRFYETGLMLIMSAMHEYLLGEDRLRHGLQLTCSAIIQGGHTTIGDMAFPFNDADREWQALQESIEEQEMPFRVQLIPRGLTRDELANTGVGEEALKEQLDVVSSYQQLNSPRVHVGNGVKLFTDGGFFGELMQLQEPGFIDGHDGEWLCPPDVFEALARLYWNEGYRIHVHCTGDLGVELALDVLYKLQFERPRFDHRFTIEHCGMTTPEQIKRMAVLGALASVNAYYLHELGDAYWSHSIGYERASQIARLGTMTREGVVCALHTDFTMAPALPLNSAWVAVNRQGESGRVLCEEEKISVMQAMRAITIDAAYILGMENDIGSIRAGKKADFTVLDEDPFTSNPERLKEIRVHATIFEGKPHLA